VGCFGRGGIVRHIARLAVALVLGLAVQLTAPASAEDGLADIGVCYKSAGKLRDGCPMSSRIRLATPDGRLAEARFILKENGKSRLYGLADGEGRTIIKPIYDKLYPTSMMGGLGLYKGQLVQVSPTGPGAPVVAAGGYVEVLGLPPFGREETNPRAVFLSTAPRDNVKRDLIPVGPDGALGRPIRGVLPLWRGGVRKVGPNWVLTVEDEAGRRGSVFADSVGKPFFAGPEVKAFQTQPLRSGREACSIRIPDDTAGIVIGPAPAAVNIDNAVLLHPLNASGRPIDLPSGVLGAVPIAYSVTEGEAGNSHMRPLACISGWVIVMQDQLRVGVGDLAAALQRLDTLAPLDEVGLVNKNGPAIAPSPWYGDNMFGVVLGKRKGEAAWLVAPTLRPELSAQSKPWGSTRVAAVETYHAEEVIARIISSASTRASAAAGAALAQQEKAEAQALLAKSSLSPEEVHRVQELTRKWGGDIEAAYYARFPPEPHQYGALCAAKGLFCAGAQTYRQQQLDLWRQDEARRAAWAAQLQDAAGAGANPDVRVSIYENGQFRTEVMPLDHFNKIYK
jgi:hypothetical protein